MSTSQVRAWGTARGLHGHAQARLAHPTPCERLWRVGRRVRQADGSKQQRGGLGAMLAPPASPEFPARAARTCKRHNGQRNASHRGPAGAGGRPKGQQPAAGAQLRGTGEEGGVKGGGAGQQSGLQAGGSGWWTEPILRCPLQAVAPRQRPSWQPLSLQMHSRAAPTWMVSAAAPARSRPSVWISRLPTRVPRKPQAAAAGGDSGVVGVMGGWGQGGEGHHQFWCNRSQILSWCSWTHSSARARLHTQKLLWQKT